MATMLYEDLHERLCRARDMLRRVDGCSVLVRDVAMEVGISPYHFIRLFRAVFGETPAQCRLAARLEHARYLLGVTDLTVTEICMQVGFGSLGTFSSVFSQRVGLSPTAYRRKVQAMAAEPGEMPAQLIPGCLSLMCGNVRNF